MSIEQALSLRHPPLAFHYAKEIPAGARSFKPFQPGEAAQGGWGCAMFLLAQAAKGGVVAFSRETCHCPGAAGGLGLGEDEEKQFPGGPEAFLRFLSSGNKHWETGRACGQKMLADGAAREMVEEYLEGEGFKKTPELVLITLKTCPGWSPKARWWWCAPWPGWKPAWPPGWSSSWPMLSGCRPWSCWLISPGPAWIMSRFPSAPVARASVFFHSLKPCRPSPRRWSA